MRDPTFWILVALLEGEAHGYALAQKVLDLSAGTIKLGAGTLYTALDRLVTEGLIELTKQTVENGRARNYYELQKLGREAIEAEIARRETANRVAKARLRLARGLA